MTAKDSAAARGRILLIDDDPVFGMWAERVLRRQGGFEFRHVLDPETALECVGTEPWDLVITDIELPRMTGLELLRRIRLLAPTLPVAVVTAHASVDRAVSALRQSAAEFLHKPIPAEEFIGVVSTLIAKGRAARVSPKESVLAVGAHPHDVEIAAAGTLLAHQAADDTVSILILSHGARGGAEDQRMREAHAAAAALGARLFVDDLENGHIAEGEPTVGMIDEVIAEVQPTVVYTHSLHDLHQDHRSTYRAVMAAAPAIGRVYCFQSPSAMVDFRPTFFVRIDDHVHRKLDVVSTFASESASQDSLDPDLVASTARYWSRFTEGSYAEAFEGIRDRAAIRSPAGLPDATSLPAPRVSAEDEN
jgi:LmbE family N-acetylglucosaminyl deacetylase/CheY-like chemotaxis protein